jgi:hypothetical protein
MQPDGQDAFIAALLSPEAPVPAEIVDPEGRRAPKRFAVYRNNVTVSLIEALASTFPGVQAMVGEAFFREMARQYVRQHPPASPVIMHYGETFPAFIEDFGPAKTLPFLGDVARLDRAWLNAYHAADAHALTAAEFQGVGEELLGTAVFTPLPASEVVKSQFPLVTLWEASRAGQPPQFGDKPVPEWAVVVRPEYEVRVIGVGEVEGTFLAALAGGALLGEATERVLALDAAFDLGAALTRVVGSGIFADVTFG